MVLSGKMSAALELKKLQAKAKRESLEKKFAFIWKAIGGPALEREWRFEPTRRWRLDFADPVFKIAVEIEGGIWMKGGGGHTHGMWFEKDAEKYFEATMAGWQVIRLTDSMITKAVLERIAHRIREFHRVTTLLGA
jgi:very-short-patch-repair endonuclease